MLAHRLRQWLSSYTALAKRLVFAESPATRYTDTMLVQCLNSVINDGTTLTQHWNQVSAYFPSVQILSIESAVTNKKEAVTSA